MKLLPQKAVQSKKRLENDELISENIRLRKYYQDIVQKLNTIKDTYEPDKLKRLEDFENFCKELTVKRSKLLEEVAGLDKLIADKKELYFGLIGKMDALDERVYQVKERERKADMRESFIGELEKNQLVT